MATMIVERRTKGKKRKAYQVWTNADVDPPRYAWQCNNHEPKFLRFLSYADTVRDAELVLERN
jgi:hypothetical protein